MPHIQSRQLVFVFRTGKLFKQNRQHVTVIQFRRQNAPGIFAVRMPVIFKYPQLQAVIKRQSFPDLIPECIQFRRSEFCSVVPVPVERIVDVKKRQFRHNDKRRNFAVGAESLNKCFQQSHDLRCTGTVIPDQQFPVNPCAGGGFPGKNQSFPQPLISFLCGAFARNQHHGMTEIQNGFFFQILQMPLMQCLVRNGGKTVKSILSADFHILEKTVFFRIFSAPQGNIRKQGSVDETVLKILPGFIWLTFRINPDFFQFADSFAWRKIHIFRRTRIRRRSRHPGAGDDEQRQYGQQPLLHLTAFPSGEIRPSGVARTP